MNEKLNENLNGKIYINNCFGKKLNGMIGPMHSNKRTIFGQGKTGRFYELGEIDITTGEITGAGEQNLIDANLVISKL